MGRMKSSGMMTHPAFCLVCLTLAAFALPGCDGRTVEVAASPGAPDAGAGDAGADAGGGIPDGGVFSHTIFTHTQTAALSGLSTGDFYTPALSYPPVEVDPKYTRVLNFMMTPFMPPVSA